VIPLEILGRNYTLHLYEPPGRVCYYDLFYGSEEIVHRGSAQEGEDRKALIERLRGILEHRSTS
jgi:hypothetical protein